MPPQQGSDGIHHEQGLNDMNVHLFLQLESIINPKLIPNALILLQANLKIILAFE